MSARHRADLAAIEERLARRQPQTAPPGMRDRVLTAIDDALAGRRFPPLQGESGISPGAIAAACGAMALTLVLLVVLTADRAARVGHGDRRMPSLADRAAAVGIVLDAEGTEHTFATVPRRYDRGIDAAAVLHPTDVARFLEGDL